MNVFSQPVRYFCKGHDEKGNVAVRDQGHLHSDQAEKCESCVHNPGKAYTHGSMGGKKIVTRLKDKCTSN